jgi:hypothetical protein
MFRKESKLRQIKHQKQLKLIWEKKNPVQKERELSLFDKVYQSREPENSKGLVMGIWATAMAHKYGE